MGRGNRVLARVAVVAAVLARRRRAGARPPAPAPAGSGGQAERPGRPGPERAAERPGRPDRGAAADEPSEIPAAGWRAILKRSWKQSREDNVPLLAAGVAFFAFLALFPALIAAMTVYGLVADPAEVEKQIASLTRPLPEETATLITEQLRSIAGGSDSALSFGFVVSLLVALWTASTGMAYLVKAVNIAYEEEESRGFLRLRAVALLMTVGALLFIVVAVGVVAVLPTVLETVGLGGFARAIIEVARWLGLVAFVMVALAVVYRYAPNRENPRFAWTSVGAVAATVLWIVGSVGFSVYVNTFGSYGETYGALAGVAVLLLWLFLASFMVLLGAEVNSEMEHQTAQDTTTGEPRPMGERGAVVADTVAS